MYHPTTRVLTVLELLQSHGRMTGAEIARRLEVNIRTARHYIDLLQELGIPIEAERGRYGAYRLRRGYKLPPLFFTEEEGLALTLGLLLARQLGLAATAPAVEGTLAKVERVLPEQVRTRLQSVEHMLEFNTGHTRIAPAGSVVMTLSTATKAERRVWMRYLAADAQETERAFDPYGVCYNDGFWYTIGYCHLRQGQRLFRLDRIRHVELRDETFTRPPDFNTSQEVERALASVPKAWQVEVRLKTTLAQAQYLTISSRSQLEEVADGVLLRCQAEDLKEMACILAGMGVPFVIHCPPELRAVFREYALMLASYAEQAEEKRSTI